MFDRKDRRKKILIGGIVAGVLLLGALGYLIYTDWESLEGVETEIKDLQGKIARAEADIKTLPGVEEEVLILRQQVKGLAKILPDDAEVTAFVDKLTDFSAEAGVQIKKAKVVGANQRRSARRGAAKTAIARVTYDVEFSGLINQILKFTDQFENQYERFVRVTKFQIQRGSASGPDLTPEAMLAMPHKIKMTLETYRYTPKTKGQKVVAIRNEGKQLERLRKSGRLDGLDEPIELATYDYQYSEDLRDPFVDPRIMRLAGLDVSDEKIAAQQAVLTELKVQLDEIHGMMLGENEEPHTVKLMMLQAKTDAALESLLLNVDARINTKFFTVKEVSDAFKAEVAVPVKQLAAARKVEKPEILAQDLKATVDGLEAQLNAGNYKGVISEVEKLVMAVGRGGNPSLADDLRRAEEIKNKAQAYLDFEQLNIAISGSILHVEDMSKSVVIINSRSFGPGETVEPGLVVKAIESGTVHFDFRGVNVIKRHDETSDQN